MPTAYLIDRLSTVNQLRTSVRIIVISAYLLTIPLFSLAKGRSLPSVLAPLFCGPSENISS